MVTKSRTLNVGIIGLGSAGAGAVPAMVATPYVRVVAAADPNAQALESFRDRYGAKTYGSAEVLCDDPDIDTVWIATPNLLHRPHVVLAASRGKHVIVEKPMAISQAECEQMIEAADKNGVQIVCGGSRSYSVVVSRMRELVRSGTLGRLQAMTTWAATDWMLRPRRPDEYDVSLGGGVGFRQAPHQVDSLRLLGGGLVRSVRAVTGRWMESRSGAPGAFSALLQFEDGVFATLTYNGYGYFLASELYDPGTSGPDEPTLAGRVEARRGIAGGTRNDAALKELRGVNAFARTSSAPAEPAQRRRGLLGDLGLLVVSCEHGDMRQSPSGIYVYNDEGVTDIALEEPRESRRPELEELYNFLVDGKPILHSGLWGLATMEVCLAIMESSAEQAEIVLRHQVPLPDWA